MSDLHPIILTPHDVNRLLLQRHFQQGQSAADGVEVLRRCIAVQAQYPSATIDAIVLRSRSLSASQVENSLADLGRTARGWSLRGTMHAAAMEDWTLLIGAVGPFQYRDFVRVLQRSRGISGEELDRLSAKIVQALQDQALSREELHERVPELSGIGGDSWGLDIKGLVLSGKVLAGWPSSGTVRFGLASPEHSAPPMEPIECLTEIARRYVRAYGPVRARDFAHWTGVPAGTARTAFEALSEELQPVTLSGHNEPFLMNPDDGLKTAGLRDAGILDGMLAKFDPLLVAYAGGSPLVPSPYRRMVYRKAAQIEGCLVLDGWAAATWRAQETPRGRRFWVETFEPAAGEQRDRMEALVVEFAARRGGRLGAVTFGEVPEAGRHAGPKEE